MPPGARSGAPTTAAGTVTDNATKTDAGNGVAAQTALSSTDKSLKVLPQYTTVRTTGDNRTVTFEGSVWRVVSASVSAASAPSIAQLAFRCTDLVDADRGHRLPCSYRRPPIVEITTTVGVPARWSVALDVAGAPSGRYSGQLVVAGRPAPAQSGSGEPGPADDASWRHEATVAVEVLRRDPPLVPLLVLAAVAALSVGLRQYRSDRADQDAAFERAAQAEALVRSDMELARPDGVGEPFRTRIAELLHGATSAVEAGQLVEAGEKLTQAETLWIKWQQGRSHWIAGLRSLRLAEAVTRQPGWQAEAEVRAGLEAQVRRKIRDAADEEKAAEYAEFASALAAWVRGCADSLAAIESAEAAVDRVADAARRADLSNRLHVLREAWKSGARDSTGLPDKVFPARFADDARRIQADAGSAPGRASARPESDDASSEEADQATELIPRRFTARIRQAQWTRATYGRAFSAAVYVGVLALGYQTTYAGKPTFGADSMDYLNLLVWGLGADLSARISAGALGGDWASVWSSLRRTSPTTSSAPESIPDGRGWRRL